MMFHVQGSGLVSPISVLEPGCEFRLQCARKQEVFRSFFCDSKYVIWPRQNVITQAIICAHIIADRSLHRCSFIVKASQDAHAIKSCTLALQSTLHPSRLLPIYMAHSHLAHLHEYIGIDCDLSRISSREASDRVSARSWKTGKKQGTPLS